jgi:predicted nucleic acid-binding protein
MVALIDTSIFIAVERGQLQWEQIQQENLDATALAAITASELLHGVHRARTQADRTKREAFVERILAGMPILSFDATTARIHARVWASLASKGIVVGAHYLLIAATAIATGSCVATRDQKGFEKIPGLKLLLW